MRKTATPTYLAAFSLLCLTGLGCYMLRPFPDIVDTRSVPIYELTSPQRINIQQAASYLDGAIIEPGAQFSFNKRVGPRTTARGYLPAPTYIGSQTAATLGGGICLVSSSLYQLALEAGLKIDARTPHLRTMQTVSPGLDATVSYGQADLAFTNTTSSPLEIRSASDGRSMRIELLGDRSRVRLCTIRSHEKRVNPGVIAAEVSKTIDGKETIVSRDIYRTRVHGSNDTRNRG